MNGPSERAQCVSVASFYFPISFAERFFVVVKILSGRAGARDAKSQRTRRAPRSFFALVSKNSAAPAPVVSRARVLARGLVRGGVGHTWW